MKCTNFHQELRCYFHFSKVGVGKPQLLSWSGFSALFHEHLVNTQSAAA